MPRHILSGRTLFISWLCCSFSHHVGISVAAILWLTVAHPKGQTVAGQGKMGDWDWASKRMEDVWEDRERKPAGRNRHQQR